MRITVAVCDAGYSRGPCPTAAGGNCKMQMTSASGLIILAAMVLDTQHRHGYNGGHKNWLDYYPEEK